MDRHTDPETVYRYLEGDMSPAETDGVTGHLKTCFSCRTDLAFATSSDDFPELFSPLSGTTFPQGTPGRFEILRPFSTRGGMGDIYVARDREVPREVAYKRIKNSGALSERAYRRFAREALLTGATEHPGIPPVYGVGIDAYGRPYYAMRLVTGTTLLQAIRDLRDCPDPPPDSAEFSRRRRELLTGFVAACNTVAYAHGTGLIHRDLKPENIILGGFGETVVLDWGLAKKFGEGDGPAGLVPEEWIREGLTQGGMGTRGYTSPEQTADWDRVGPATDIYSLGATLYTILVGSAPPGPEPALPPGVSPPLAAVCRMAMAADPASRYASAKALAADVDLWLAGEPVSAYPEPWTDRLQRRASRRWCGCTRPA